MIRDHEGNIFSNQKRMCEAHGVNYLTYHTRKRKGWTMEECLGYKKRVNPKATNKENSRKTMDHLGQEFHSTRAMCFHWNVSQAVFNGRINRG